MELLQPLLAITFVFTLLALFVWKFGRGMPARIWPTRRDSNLASTDRMRLTPQHSVHVVSACGRRWLMACHPGGVTLLAELGEAGEELRAVRKSGAAA